MRGPRPGWENAAAPLPPSLVRPFPKLVLLLALAAIAASPVLRAADKQTVCTVTVNSADEREVMRRNLAPDRFDFVELVEHGRPAWLASACERKVRCDVLVVSGHFAGDQFYSSRPEVNETLGVDEMERVACSASCPELFAHLKEVYLFGCDSLKAQPVRSAMPEVIRDLVRAGTAPAEAQRIALASSERHAEDARDRMRRIFAGVPVIYGFSSLAPYGRTAGPLLQRYFDTAPGLEVGSGTPSRRLLALFGPASMVATNGMEPGEAIADYRRAACRFYDDRLDDGARLAAIHGLLASDMAEVRMTFEPVEKFFAGVTAERRAQPAYGAALARIAADRAARARYLAITRATGEAALRVRMIALARTVGWLAPAEEHEELAATIADLFTAGRLAYGDVDLVCTLNRDGALDDALARVKVDATQAGAAAASACLGSAAGRTHALAALASAREADVQLAESYLRHRPIADAQELRSVARAVAGMKNAAAQARALDTLARQHVADAAVLDELADLFAHTTSLRVQRAIAEIYLRSDPAVLEPRIAMVLRRHRLKSPDGEDLIDEVVRRVGARGKV